MNIAGPISRIDKDSLAGHLRRAGINPNCWYMIAKSSEIKERLLGREIWRQPVVLFRTATGEIRAIEDSCAHGLVRLSHGRIVDGNIECVYHGWRFDAAGRCVHIPHLASNPTLPDCGVRSFPVME